MTTMFQKRHYNFLENILHVFWLIPDSRSTITALVNTLADFFEADNPLFLRARFIDGCTDRTGV